MKYFKKISGEHIYLSPVNPEDTEQFTRWVNDPAVAKKLGMYHRNFSLPTEQKFLEQMAGDDYAFAIVLHEGDRLLGSISLMEVSFPAGSAVLGLFIGDAGQRGKGYGTEAIRILLAYAFDTLNLQNIMLTVNADNAQGIACYQKAGFKEFGRRRNAGYKDGVYFDVVYMEILRSDFAGA